jgi:hypothetical protein
MILTTSMYLSAMDDDEITSRQLPPREPAIERARIAAIWAACFWLALAVALALVAFVASLVSPAGFVLFGWALIAAVLSAALVLRSPGRLVLLASASLASVSFAFAVPGMLGHTGFELGFMVFAIAAIGAATLSVMALRRLDRSSVGT